jgi:hypothetical protein
MQDLRGFDSLVSWKVGSERWVVGSNEYEGLDITPFVHTATCPLYTAHFLIAVSRCIYRPRVRLAPLPKAV